MNAEVVESFPSPSHSSPPPPPPPQVAGCSGKFQLQSREDSCIKYIREKVGSAKVMVRVWI